MNYLSVENLSKSFGEKTLFNGLTFGIEEGQKVALIAKNGAGKTTLLKILAGKETADSGKVVFRSDLRIGYLEQHSDFSPDKSIMEIVIEAGNPGATALRNYNDLLEREYNPDELEEATNEMNRTQAWDYEARMEQILGKLGLHDTSLTAGKLSGGQKKRLALAQVLIGEPEFMILDEPTNHLDLDMIEWLEGYLSASHITLLMVTHDRYFLERVCDEILELENGMIYRYKGSYSYFLEKKAEREQNEQATIEKAKNLFRKELDWMRRQPKARTTKAKSRIDAFYDVKETASRRIKKDEISLNINMQRIGGKILEFHHAGKKFGDKKILDDFSYIFKRGEKIGIVGPNGVGKTTFLNMIMEKESVDRGKITAGETIVFGYYSQEGMKIPEDKRVIEVIRDIAEFIPMAGGKKITALQLLERFMFPATMHYQYVSKLSGGEKRRLYLLTILMKNPNFLILDEPTNDLDVFTLTALEDYLENFEGCVLVVTHDRYFMDRIADHIFVFEGEGKIKDILGNYSDYREQKNAGLISDPTKAGEQKEKITEEKNTAVQPKEKEYSRTDTKRKLSYKEKFEFEQLDKEIPMLEEKRKNLEEAFNSGTLNADQIAESAKNLNQLNSEIEEKTMRWMELAEFYEKT